MICSFPFFCSVSPSENSEYVCSPSRSERLILEELTQPSHLGRLIYPPYKKVCKTSDSTDYQKKSRDQVIIFRSDYLKYLPLHVLCFYIIIVFYYSYCD
jgi:hypothetical protein